MDRKRDGREERDGDIEREKDMDMEAWSFVSRDLLGLGRRSCLFGLVVLMRVMRQVGLETRERQMGGWCGVCRNGREPEVWGAYMHTYDSFGSNCCVCRNHELDSRVSPNNISPTYVPAIPKSKY